MTRSITTLALIGISALIILYILSSFYKVLNREPIHAEVATIESELLQDSTDPSLIDEVQGDTTSNDELLATEDKLEDLVSEPEATEEEVEEEAEVEVVGTPGEILREKPHLQNALPPIPQAPPRPQGSPAITSPVEESYSQTGSSNSPFPAPITNTNPAPTNSTPTTRTNPATANSASSTSAFPAPIVPSQSRPSSSSSSSNQASSSFPAPR